MKDESKSHILNQYQLQNLRTHVYRSSGKTILDPYMQVLWCWLVERVPLWVAPNMITLVGLLINIITTLLLMFYSNNGRSTAPAAAYVACGIGLFVYQSLDAIDGKHARRTGTANPLGELFDHGCDAFSTVFVVIAYGIATDLGASPWFFFVFCLCNLMFYAAHWQTLVSGNLNFGRIDVTEAQLFLVGVQLWTGAFGAGLWNLHLYQGIQVKHAMLITSCTSSIVSFIQSGNAATIVSGGSGKNGSTIADTSILSPGIPILVLTGMFYRIMSESPEKVYHEHHLLFIVTLGLAFTKITNSLVVAHMTMSPPTLVADSIMVGPALMLINQYLNVPVQEGWLLHLVMLYTAYDSIRYCIEICREICDGLGIPCLTMPTDGVNAVPAALKRSKSRNASSETLTESPKRLHSSSSRLLTYSATDIQRARISRASARAGARASSGRRSTDSGSGASVSDWH